MSPPPHRVAMLLLGGAALLAGLTGALVLLGVPMPSWTAGTAARHGVLMSLGFLGTLIALERAVALGRVWGYASPLAAGTGGAVLVTGGQAMLAFALLTIAAAVFVAMYVAFDRIERSLHTSIQALGALAWLGAAALLLAGWTPNRVVPWIAAFLVLTIAGERLELSRLGRVSGRARIGFGMVVGVFCIGVVASTFTADAGVRLAGIGAIGMAIWLGRNDLARRTVRMPGAPRFVAISLLAGYAWLVVGGLTWLAFGSVSGGAAYDAMLHAIFLGFVISMVFGHAPIILPAVLDVQLPFHPRFYAHLALLHVGLVVRIVGGDLVGSESLRVLGGVLNVVALLTFVASSALAIVLAPHPPARVAAPSSTGAE